MFDISKHERDNEFMDTQKTVQELLSTGLTQIELAKLIPCSQSLISALKNGNRGQRLSFHFGKRLAYLHKKHCRHSKVEIATENLKESQPM